MQCKWKCSKFINCRQSVRVGFESSTRDRAIIPQSFFGTGRWWHVTCRYYVLYLSRVSLLPSIQDRYSITFLFLEFLFGSFCIFTTMANPKPFTLEEHPADEYPGLKVYSFGISNDWRWRWELCANSIAGCCNRYVVRTVMFGSDFVPPLKEFD